MTEIDLFTFLLYVSVTKRDQIYAWKLINPVSSTFASDRWNFNYPKQQISAPLRSEKAIFNNKTFDMLSSRRRINILPTRYCCQFESWMKCVAGFTDFPNNNNRPCFPNKKSGRILRKPPFNCPSKAQKSPNCSPETI